MRRFDHVRRSVERYTPLDFHSTFVLSSINYEPIFVKATVKTDEGKIWKKAMVEEIAALDKNEDWNWVKFPDGRKPIVVNGCSRRN